MHVLLLDEASAYHLIDRRFDERGADRFSLPVALAKVRDGLLVVANVGLELRHARCELLRRRRVVPNQFKIQEQVGQPLEGILDIAMPEQVLDALYLLRDRGPSLCGSSFSALVCCCRTISRMVM